MSLSRRAGHKGLVATELSDSERSAYFERMLSLSPAVIYSCGPGPDYPTTYISQNVFDQLGFAPAEFYDDAFCWAKLIHPDDSTRILEQLGTIATLDRLTYDYRVRHRDGGYLWVHDQVSPVRDAGGVVQMLVGSWMDITDRKRSEAEHEGQNRVLASLATGADLDEVLLELVEVIEAQADGMQCAIAIYNPSKNCLGNGTAPSLPRAYSRAIDGLAVGPKSGSCGTAAYRRQRVIVEDVEVDPLWEEFRHLARRFKIRACWSQPILSSDNQLLGTFAMYYRDPRGPSAAELRLIEHAARIAAIAIQRKWTDASLRDSEARYQDLYENAPDMFASLDPKTGRIVQCNNTLSHTTGLTKDEIVGRHIAELCEPASESALRSAIDILARKGKVQDVVLRLKCKHRGGMDVSLNMSSLRDDEGNITACRSILRDITIRKRTEAALQEQTRLTKFGADVREAFSQKRTERGILQHCVEAMVRHLDAAFARIWTLNRTTEVLELQASAGMYTHTDGAHARIALGAFKIGRIAQDRKPRLTNNVIGDPNIPEQEWARREGIVAFAGYPLTIEARVVGVMAIFSKTPLKQAALSAMSAVAEVIAMGIERRRAEDALLRSERLASIGTLAAGIAHEINNPIAAILLAARHALTSMERPDWRLYSEDCLEGIVRDADRCARIITNVLQFAKTGDTQRWPCHLKEVLRQAMDLVEAYAMDKNVSLDLHVDDGLPEVAGNPSQLVQVFVNLIGNGIEAGDRDNRVTIRADRQGDAARIIVMDNGRGMTSEQQKHLFDPFYTTREREGGTGLGLSIAHGIVLSHGGAIDVESEPGCGTRMKVMLPLANSA